MSSKVTKSIFVNLIGLNSSGKIDTLPIICWRKPASKERTRMVMKHYRYALGMVSAYNIYRKANTPYCNAWCHCFRNPETFLGNKPSILLSESDFVDEKNIVIYPKKEKVWDFFYFTMGGNRPGNKFKGMDLFADCLPILCGKYNLKGIVIKYGAVNSPYILTNSQKSNLKKYSRNLRFVNKKLPASKIAKIMACCRFGLFPNKKDCSPIMLSESMLRNTPILVNENILGGWKYVVNETGVFFNIQTLNESIDKILSGNFSPKEYFLQNYGYKKTATRLCDFVLNNYPIKNYEMIAFNRTNYLMNYYGQK